MLELGGSGITKGYAVDRMLALLSSLSITNALMGFDGEMRACGARPAGQAWTVALERPDYETRAPLSIIELTDTAVATSGNYHHWVEAGGKRLSNTMDPARSGPLSNAPASVTVLAETCVEADAWATAFIVARHQTAIPRAAECWAVAGNGGQDIAGLQDAPERCNHPGLGTTNRVQAHHRLTARETILPTASIDVANGENVFDQLLNLLLGDQSVPEPATL